MYDTLDDDLDAGVETRLSYVICSTPRSGSYLLCELLWRTGLAGAPEEFFHPEKMPHLMRRWGVGGLDEYLRALLAHKTSPNGVFGAKVHWGQYSPVLGDRDPNELFPNTRFVHITRGDRLRQAVSWVRAMQSQRWTSAQQRAGRGEPVFDAADIAAKLRRLEGDESRWHGLFERHGIVPHEVEYEELTERPAEVVAGTLAHIGIEAPDPVLDGQPSLRRQSDSISDEWVARFTSLSPPPGSP
jgi:LPS sulfotransferase NodH